MNPKFRVKKVIEWFSAEMPIANSELNYKSTYELLVAVILSAQCTDKRVNQLTPLIFETYPTPYELANATFDAIFSLIKSCSYPNNKSKHLIGMAKVLVGKFEGVVPNTIEQLQELPGVGRKTANVILSVAFNKPAMAVDTHVFRVAARIGLTENAKNPLETEKQLVALFPESLQAIAHHWLILHGRYVCKARKPECENCGLTKFCIYYDQHK